MPRFDDPSMGSHQIKGSSFGFSGARLDDLGSSTYTLVTIAADCSGSVSRFKHNIEDCIGAVIAACAQAPHADHLLVRVLAFGDTLQEIHGFKPLTACSATDYAGALPSMGLTALNDASHNSFCSLSDYADNLAKAGIACNGLSVVITDGFDNSSQHVLADVVAARSQAEAGSLESLLAMLVGVNIQGDALEADLRDFKEGVGFDRFVSLESADAATLARLAAFVTRSIAAQSIALGSGAASIPLGF